MRVEVKSYVQALVATALGTRPAGRNVTVFPDDIFLVSYLRSGSTWLRFLFGNFIYDQPVTFANVGQLVPAINELPDRKLRNLPRILKSHECFDPRYPRVIYVVRDPRDVAVSFYFYNLKVRVLPEGYPIEEFVERWVAAQVVNYADRLGSWEDHVLSWLRMRQGKPNFCLIRYEDLIDNPAEQLLKAAPLLGVTASPEKVSRAIELSSASNMRRLEGEQWQNWQTTKNTRSDIRFVREAKAGQWRQKLPPAAVARIEGAWRNTMLELGYQLSSSRDFSGASSALPAGISHET